MLEIIFKQINPTAHRKAEIVYNSGLSECNRVKSATVLYTAEPYNTTTHYKLILTRSLSHVGWCPAKFLDNIYLQYKYWKNPFTFKQL